MHCHNTSMNNRFLESIIEKKVQQETNELAYLQDAMYDFIKTIKEIILGEYSDKFFNDFVNHSLEEYNGSLEEMFTFAKNLKELKFILEDLETFKTFITHSIEENLLDENLRLRIKLEELEAKVNSLVTN